MNDRTIEALPPRRPKPNPSALIASNRSPEPNEQPPTTRQTQAQVNIRINQDLLKRAKTAYRLAAVKDPTITTWGAFVAQALEHETQRIESMRG